MPMVIVGDAENSYLVQKIRGDDGISGNPMPPPSSYDPLPAGDLQVIKDWINTGASE
jgi:hypothetical protein